MNNKADRLEKLMTEMLEIYKAKNKDYGDSFSESFEEFGLIAPVVRMNDKMNRIKSLTRSGDRQVQDESLRDSLMDLANYALMTVVELDKEVEGEDGELYFALEPKNKFSNNGFTVTGKMEDLGDAIKELVMNNYEAGRQENL